MEQPATAAAPEPSAPASTAAVQPPNAPADAAVDSGKKSSKKDGKEKKEKKDKEGKSKDKKAKKAKKDGVSSGTDSITPTSSGGSMIASGSWLAPISPRAAVLEENTQRIDERYVLVDRH